MENRVVHRIKTISEYHRVMGLPKPMHSLISVVNYESLKMPCLTHTNLILDFYSVVLDSNFKGKMKYGQQTGDFEEGIMFFMAPGQIFEMDAEDGSNIHRTGWILLIDPHFLWNTPLAKSIKQYDYFSYAVNEALFLSDKEETAILGIMNTIVNEYKSNIDKFSEPVIIAQLALLFTYADRFYQRQFITRKISNHSILERLEDLLDNYFRNDALATDGIPTVQFIAETLHISASYLSALLKVLTGKSTQHYIHDKLIENAKQKLSTTNLSVSEIAYELGFEHPQSFSRLFKAKTNLSPLQFRASFN